MSDAAPPQVHPAAIVEPGAELGPGVVVGPWCHVGPRVRLGAGVVLVSHVVVDGLTEIGEGTKVWPFACLGARPQDLKFAGEDTRLVIGRNNMIREYVTMNPGTSGGTGLTSVGDGCLFMVSSHVGHDCSVGNGVIVANNAPLGGHVTVGDRAIIGGNAAIHQFARIGTGAIVGGLTGVERDVIPYGSATGDRARLVGLNLVGLRRAGVSRERIATLKAAYEAIFNVAESGGLAERARRAAETWGEEPLVRTVCDFILEGSSRSFTTPREE